MPQLTLTLPRPHPGQKHILDNAKRFNVIACGRRFGKSQMGINLSVESAVQGHPVAWFSPTYRMLSDIWRQVRDLLRPFARHVSEDEHRIELLSGGTIEFWSLDSGDTARGRRYKRVILDEAALDANLLDHWQAAIRPTLTDLRGDAWFLSTPRGMGGFKQLYLQGASGDFEDWASFTAPTAQNPFIHAEEIAAARQDLPERTFSQEYLAEFVGDGIGVFRFVREAATAIPRTEAEPGHRYVVGADWGKLDDYSAFSVLDVTNPRAIVQVALERFNQIDYFIQVGRLKVLCERFHPPVVVAERNSIGEPVLEQCVRIGIPIHPWTATNSSKNLVVEALSLAFERRQIRILPHVAQLNELDQFTTQRLPSGLLRYTAPEGVHDDTVIALCLSWMAACMPSGKIVQRDFAVVTSR